MTLLFLSLFNQKAKYAIFCRQGFLNQKKNKKRDYKRRMKNPPKLIYFSTFCF